MSDDKTFVRAKFNWLDVLLLAVMGSIMVYSIVCNVGMGD
jgi:hypothetical protein